MFGTVKVAFIVFFVFLGSLFFREQRVPKSWVDRLSERLSPAGIVLQCDGLSFGFRRGLHASGIRVYDRGKKDFLTPAVSVRSLTIDPFRRKVRLDSLKYPRLPDSYYAVGECREKSGRLGFEFPDVPGFRLVLERPEILGLTPDRVTAQVNVRRKLIAVDGIRIDWPDKTHRMELDGSFRFDLVSQQAHGEVRGESTTAQIRPLIVALDVPSALPYMDAFTEIAEPVPAQGLFDVDLTNNDFRMRLDLKPKMGRYNGVPMSRAEGVLDLCVYTRGTNCNVTLGVDLPLALDPEGRKLTGGLTMKMTNEQVRLSYDVRSELAFRDALEIADFMDPEALGMVVCETKPVVTVKGVSGVSAADAGSNDLAFTARLARGSFMGLKLRDLETDFSIVGERIGFSRIEARGKTGGRYSGTAWLENPGYDGNRMTFGSRVACRGGSLEELADLFDFDLGRMEGVVDGWCELTGPASSNCVASLDGSGSIKIANGHLAQMKLFAGLTELLADKVPGVGFLVNQSEASADFTVTNGVFRSGNVFIEGGLISLKAWGEYDIPRDALDFTVRVQFLKSDSVLGTVVRPVTWPFSKLLLEFRAKGSLENPEWEYISILDRIL